MIVFLIDSIRAKPLPIANAIIHKLLTPSVTDYWKIPLFQSWSVRLNDLAKYTVLRRQFTVQPVKDWQREIANLGERFHLFKARDPFGIWIQRAYIVESDETAADSISSGANDKGIDDQLVNGPCCYFVITWKLSHCRFP